MQRHHTNRAAVGAALLVALATLGACGDDDEAASAEEPTTTTAIETPADEPTTTTADHAEHVDVTAVDYAFEDLPAEMPAGSELRLHNASEAELHEIVAFRLPDGEARELDELLALPEPELEALVGIPRAVILARPGEDGEPALGDGRLTEPGRYLLLCAIPVGVDPDEYLAAAEAAGGQPQGFDTPPHFTAGMVSEVLVR